MKYFVIFPHAGAVKSNYVNIIRHAETNDNKCLYINYMNIHTKNNSLEEFTHELKEILQLEISKYDELIIFGHSMGCLIIQELSDFLNSNFTINKIILSDTQSLNHIIISDFSKLSDLEIEKIIDKYYDIPNKIRENPVLYQFFKNILIKDLEIIEKLKNKYMHLQKDIYFNSNYITFICSEYKNVISIEYKKYFITNKCQKIKQISIKGNHYKILESFSELNLL